MTTRVGTFLLTLHIFRTFTYTFRQWILLNFLTQEMFDLLETIDVCLADKCNGYAITISTCCTTYTVNIVFCIMRYIVIDNRQDIIDIDTTGHNIGSHKHICHTSLKAIHHLVTFLLGEIGMHLGTIDMHLFQIAGDFLYLLFLTREDNDTLEVTCLENVVDDLQFLRIIADVGRLTDLLCWFRYSYFDLHRIVEQGHCQLANLRRHSSREHDTLTTVRQFLHNRHDILYETHVEHTISLVEYEERTT